MIRITYANKAAEAFSEATKYRLEDGWYVLTDDSDEEVGRAQAKDVQSIRKGEEKIGGFA
jgi:hypothetical protein